MSGPVDNAPRRVLTLAALTGLAVLVAFLTACWLSGYRAAVVESGSMGTAAPVGSLIITRAPTGPVAPGAIVTVAPPGPGAGTDTHRVRQTFPDGSFITRGDLNDTDDPWVLQRQDLVGVAVAVLPGVGYALRLAAIALAGIVLLMIVTRFVPHRRARHLIWLAGTGFAAAAAFAIVHPIGWFQLVSATATHARTTAVVVSTSVLPETITLDRGSSALLRYGQHAPLHTATRADPAHLQLHSALALPWWGWLILLAFCAAPTVVGILLLSAHRRPSVRGARTHRATA